MDNKITINFSNIISELEEKNLKLCFLNNNRGLFIQDSQNNLYDMKLYRKGSCLGRLVKDGITVKFDCVDTSISQNISDWEKEIWCISDVKDFMTRQKL